MKLTCCQRCARLGCFESAVCAQGDASCGDCQPGTYVYKEQECRSCTLGTYAPSALADACRAQQEGKTTVLEIMVTRELGDPFRRDALKLPKRLLSKYKDYSND